MAETVDDAPLESTVPGLDTRAARSRSALGEAIGAANYWHTRAKRAEGKARLTRALAALIYSGGVASALVGVAIEGWHRGFGLTIPLVGTGVFWLAAWRA